MIAVGGIGLRAGKSNRSSRITDQYSKVEMLLVDDSRTYAYALQRQFRELHGISVTHCDSMEALTATLKEDSDRFTIAVSDLNLPDAPSGEALDFLLERNIPTIVFTGTFCGQMREAVLARTVVDYVLKESPESIRNVVSCTVRLLANRHIHVLVVDDMASTRELMAQHLRSQMFQVTTASGAQEAFRMLDVHPDIDLAVIDQEMPGMCGTDLVKEIRTNADFERLRIIGISSTPGPCLLTRFLKAGANDFIHRPFDMEEYHWRVAQNVQTILHVRHLRELAARDFLTGLYNRRHFFEEGPRRVTAGRSVSSSMSMAVMDIDNFKRLNDTYGHEIGDVMLKAVAERLLAACGTGPLIARLGGEEFGILLTGMQPSEARVFCDNLRKSVEIMRVPTDDGELQVTISIGLAEIAEIETFDNYLNAADQFLYMAKHAGRNCVISDLDIGSRAA